MKAKTTAYSWETEHRLAALACGYTWAEFVALPGNPWSMGPDDDDCKAAVVALYRITQVFDAMSEDFSS